MLKRFLKSAYGKAALTFVACGVVLMFVNKWIGGGHSGSLISHLNDALTPVYIGIIISFLLCPLYNRIVKNVYSWTKKRHHAPASERKPIFSSKCGKRTDELMENRHVLTIARVVATAICVLLIISLITLLAYFVLPQVINSVIELVNTMPKKLSALSQWTEEHLKRFPDAVAMMNKIANTGMTEIIEWVQANILKENVTSLATQISGRIMQVIVAFVNIFVGILIAIYILNFKERLFAISRKMIAAICSENKSKNIYEFSSIVNETFIGFIVGRILDAIVIGILTYIGMSIFGIPLALLISVIVGVTNIIPFFGPFLGAIPSFVLILLEDPVKAVWFVVLILVIQQLDGNIICPKIVGNAIGINSFWVLVSVLVGGGMFGFPGMLLGAPVFAVIYRYVDKITMRSLGKKDRNTTTDDYVDFSKFGIDKREIFKDE